MVLRPSFTMGGAGGGIVYNINELKTVCERGLQASLVGQVLVEECITGWAWASGAKARPRASDSSNANRFMLFDL